MIKNYILYFGLLLSLNLYAQLNPGDIAFLGMNTDATEGYSFITLNNIPGNEIIFFSDRGIINNGAYIAGTEGTYRFTAPAGGISCGTIISFDETSPDTYTITGVTGATMTLEAGSANLGSGDQVYAYQTAGNTISAIPSDATFIAAIMSDYDAICVDGATGWTQSSCVSSTSESIVPPGLTNGVNCISMTPSGPEIDNMRYTGTLTGDSFTLRTAIHNPANWETNNSPRYDLTPGNYQTPNVSCIPLSTDEFSLENKITLAPNPVQENRILNINNNSQNTIISVEVFDVIGKKVYSTTSVTENIQFPTNTPSGMYFVKITDSRNNNITKKVIIE
ncbi:T9SS type A sorting domain-containing protein [Pseudofulvibacter geojedonensis]|uniref:T9SS type A sorting domain-containing protein n=1 Tax=Pseudofulvibacter geojedonensis TaxID=1123758 RepID=A0ABW3I4E0_9FLAO